MNTKATENTNSTAITVPTDWTKQTNALAMALDTVSVNVSESELTPTHYAELSGGDSTTEATFTNMIDCLRTAYKAREQSETAFIITLAYAVNAIDNSNAKDTKTVITMAIPDLSDSYSNYLKAVKSLINYGTNADTVKYLASFGATKLKVLWNKDKAETVLAKLKNGEIVPTMTVRQIAEAVTPKTLVNTNTEADKTKADKAKAEANKTKAEADKAKAEANKATAEAITAKAEADKAKAEADKAKAEAEAEAEKVKAEAENAKAEAENAKKMTFDKVVNFINKCDKADMLNEIIKIANEKLAIITK